MEEKSLPKYVDITDKGLAVLAAIDAGLIPEDENGDCDTEAFERFWAIYQETSINHIGSRLEHAQKHISELVEMLNREREQRAYDRAEQRVAQRRLFLATLAGFLIGGLTVVLL